MRKTLNKIDINLATRKKEVTAGKAFFAGVLVLAAVALILSFYNIYEYKVVSGELKRYTDKVAEIEHRVAEREPGLLKSLKVNAATVRGEVEFINGIIDRKSFMWSVLLSDLEAAVPTGVYLVSIKPDFANGAVNITGVARSLKVALRMVDSMGASKRFSDVYLLNHSRKKSASGGRTKLFFDVTATYKDGKGQ